MLVIETLCHPANGDELLIDASRSPSHERAENLARIANGPNEAATVRIRATLVPMRDLGHGAASGNLREIVAEEVRGSRAKKAVPRLKMRCSWARSLARRHCPPA